MTNKIKMDYEQANAEHSFDVAVERIFERVGASLDAGQFSFAVAATALRFVLADSATGHVRVGALMLNQGMPIKSIFRSLSDAVGRSSAAAKYGTWIVSLAHDKESMFVFTRKPNVEVITDLFGEDSK